MKKSKLENLYDTLSKEFSVKFQPCENCHQYDQIVFTRLYTTVFITKTNSRGFNIWSQNDEEGEGETLAKSASVEDVHSFLHWVSKHQ